MENINEAYKYISAIINNPGFNSENDNYKEVFYYYKNEIRRKNITTVTQLRCRLSLDLKYTKNSYESTKTSYSKNEIRALEEIIGLLY